MIGLLVGSFLNVVIYRLPIMMQRAWAAEHQEWLDEQSSTETGAPGDVDDALGAEDASAADGPLASTRPQIRDSVTAKTAADDPLHSITPAEPLAEEVFNLAEPRSACPHCDRQIQAIENIPVLSYLALGGKCRGCRAPISKRYPLVEMLTGLLTLWVALRFGATPEAVAAAVLTWFLIALSGIDIDHQLLPDSMTLPLMWIGLTLSLFSVSGATTLFIAPQDAIVGALAGYLSLWSIYHLFRLVTGKHGMGYGDFKLLAALGAWLGWQSLPIIVLLSAAVGSVYGIAMVLARRHRQGAPMPFGPWLAAAGWITMMYGDQLSTWYYGVIGL
ncbi:MAG: A24 family peptidase [Pseudomonadota bacterium]